MADPLSDAFAWLDSALKADADLGPTIKIGNWIGGTAADSLKGRIHRAPADFDEIRIMPANGGNFPLGAARTGDVQNFKWTQVFAVQMATGSAGFATRLLPLKFKVLRALARAAKATPVFGVQPIDVSESNDPSDLNRNTANWTGVIAVAVAVQFTSNDYTT